MKVCDFIVEKKGGENSFLEVSRAGIITLKIDRQRSMFPVLLSLKVEHTHKMSLLMEWNRKHPVSPAGHLWLQKNWRPVPLLVSLLVHRKWGHCEVPVHPPWAQASKARMSTCRTNESVSYNTWRGGWRGEEGLPEVTSLVASDTCTCALV